MKEPSSVANFLHELEVAHSLRHPNIVLYMGLSIDPEKNHAYIVQEFVSKHSLFELLHGSERQGTEQPHQTQKTEEQQKGEQEAKGGLGALPDDVIFRVAK